MKSNDDDKLPNPLGWQDIKISIEAKLKQKHPILQIARYARCMKLEQSDRKFFYTLNFTKNTCRAAR